LAVANTADQTVQILLGGGRGLFETYTILYTYGSPVIFTSIRSTRTMTATTT